MTLFLTHPCILYSFKNWDKGFLPLNNLSREWGCVQRAVKTNESEEKRVAEDLGPRAEHATTLPFPPSEDDDDSFKMLLLKLFLSHKTISLFLLCLSFQGARVADWWPQRPSSTASRTCLDPSGLYGLLSRLHQNGHSVAPPHTHPPHPARLSEPLHCIIELCCLDVPLPLFQQPGDPRKLLVCLNKTLNPPY